jgi:hypothetical protein
MSKMDVYLGQKVNLMPEEENWDLVTIKDLATTLGSLLKGFDAKHEFVTGKFGAPKNSPHFLASQEIYNETSGEFDKLNESIHYLQLALNALNR